MIASERTGLPAYILEKDYMVSFVLSLLFEKIKPLYTGICSIPYVFKGGTSLSKIYHVINRMSEDLDLSVSMELLGYPEPELESNSARDRRIKLLRDANIDFVHTLAGQITDILKVIHSEFEVLIDTKECQNIIIHYPRSLSEDHYMHSYVRPRVLLETGGRAALIPYESRQSEPLIIDELKKHLGTDTDCMSAVDVLSIDRTFFEKITLLHELNKRGPSCVTQRMARHLYDILQIYETRPDSLENHNLLLEVRDHKAKYFRRNTAEWNYAEPGTLAIIPSGEVEKYLREDWLKMADLFPRSILPYSFDHILGKLHIIDSYMNHRS